MYSKKLINHLAHPHNCGGLENPDGVGLIRSPLCGDELKVYIKIKDDKVEDIRFESSGCSAAIASSSVGTTLIKGKTIAEGLRLTSRTIVEALGGLPEKKVNCSVLVQDAFRAAVEDYLKHIRE